MGEDNPRSQMGPAAYRSRPSWGKTTEKNQGLSRGWFGQGDQGADPPWKAKVQPQSPWDNRQGRK